MPADRAATADGTSSAAIDAEALSHEAIYRVRFDEAGPNGLVRTSGLLRYAQDVAWQHSTALGFDRAWYAERGLTWLVRAADLEVLAPIPMGAEIRSRTSVVGQRRVWARRRGEFTLPDGTLCGWVHTDWVMIDGRGALIRIPAVFGERFQIPEASGQIGRVPLAPAPQDASTRSFAARPHELDPMAHVNNAVYVDWLEEAIVAASRAAGPETIGALPRRYRLEYAGATDAGMTVQDTAWRDGATWAYRLTVAGGAELFRATVSPGGGEP